MTTKKAKESYEKWMEMIEDLKWKQACEHQENFEKAAALAISPFSKSEEESRLEKWLEPPMIKKIIVPDFLSSQLK